MFYSYIADEHQHRPVSTVFVTIKTSYQNISIYLDNAEVSLKLTNIEAAVEGTAKVPRTIIRRVTSVEKVSKSKASKIGNGVSSLL